MPKKVWLSKSGKPHGNRGKKHTTDFCLAVGARSRGRTNSAEARKKISAALKGVPKSISHNKKVSAALTGIVRKPMSQAHKDAIGLGNRGKVVSDETRGKLSKASFGHKLYHTAKSFPYNGVRFRSSWERFVARAFDKKGIKWVYEPKQFNLGSATYVPDFYLPDQETYWEVKGWYGPESQLKAELFREVYPDEHLIIATKRVIECLDPSFATFDPRRERAEMSRQLKLEF